MKMWLGSERPITILDLSGVPSSMMIDIIGIVLRVFYDGLFWARNLSEGGRERPLLIVMEEAHTYLNDNIDGAASTVVQRSEEYTSELQSLMRIWYAVCCLTKKEGGSHIAGCA